MSQVSYMQNPLLTGASLSSAAAAGVSGTFSNHLSPIFSVSFLVIASRVIRPGHVFRLSITNYSPQTLNAHASILRDGLDISSADQTCVSGVPEIMMLRVPAQALEGTYKLKVDGRTESDEVVFSNETQLEFNQRSITIFVQTDKPIYKQGQIVKFRTVPITTDLRPFSEALDLYMLDPNGIIVKRWLSKQTNLGSVSLEYPLSSQPVLGNWTIRVTAQGQVQDSYFMVEEYYAQQFEVKVQMASEFLDTDEFISGSISANFTSGAPVSGNLTVVITGESAAGFRESATESEYRFSGFTDFRYKMSDLRRLLQNRVENSRITVSAFVGEPYLDLYQSGFAKAQITSSRVKLKFVGPSVFVFKPYMTFDCYLAASYLAGSPLGLEQLQAGYLDVRLTAINRFGSALMPNKTFEVTPSISTGTWKITIDIKSYVTRQSLAELDHLRLDANFYETGQVRGTTSVKIYPIHSPSARSLQVTMSTQQAQVGDYVILHVSANYKVDIINYVIISKGLIQTSGRERIKSSPTTFAIPVSAEMVPSSTILVYDITRNNELVIDALTFHVEPNANSNNISLILNANKDKHGDLLEVAVYGQPGTYVGLTATSKELASLSEFGQLSQLDFEQQMQNFEDANSLSQDSLIHHWLTVDGSIKDIVHFPSPAQGIDAQSVLDKAGLIVFSDAFIPRKAFTNNNCGSSSATPSTNGLQRCLVVDKCYNATLYKCNGRDDCGDLSDESNCNRLGDLIHSRQQYRFHRFNRIEHVYDENWLWKDINIGPLGHYIFNVRLPSNIATTWNINAFSMSQSNGMTIMKQTQQISNLRPFVFKLEMPKTCNLGEQIGLRAIVFNLTPKEIEVMLQLASSQDYKFVKVDELGKVSSYNPETLFGEHQHLIKVAPHETTYVHVPIVAQHLGAINVTLSASTQAAKKTISKTLQVEPDGIKQSISSSIVLDLSQGSYLIKYLDTNLTESPVVKYDKMRRYIFGSNRATLSVSGGVVGPIFPNLPFDTNTTMQLPSDCGEQNMFNFAINLLSISYLRKTSQETPELKRDVFKHLNLLYQRQLSFRNRDGSFRVFRSSVEPSVWLTAFVAQYFHMATGQEWENYIYIDSDVIDSAIGWLVSKQTSEGAFIESSFFAHDRKLDNGARSPQLQSTTGPATSPLFISNNVEDFRMKNISLTAYVLIALHNVKDRVGDQSVRANNARILAQKYLESLLHRTTIKTAQDPFDLAIVTYALNLVNSIDGDEAYNYLDKRMLTSAGLRYWGPEMIPIRIDGTQNNRNIIYPRSRGKFDSKNIQTTAYALLTHIQRQTQHQRDIVEWLNTQRLSSGAWSSTQDSILALQSLIEYSIQSEHRSVTDLKITVDTPTQYNMIQSYQQRLTSAAPRGENEFRITETNISSMHKMQIPSAHGIFTVRAEGSGMALVLLNVHYNVDWPQLQVKPPIKAFDLDVRPSYSGHNSSIMHMDICTRWTSLSEGPRSGMAVLEAPVPTGYMISQNSLDKIVNASSSSGLLYPQNLREARATDGKVYFYFDYIDDKRTCVQFTLNRWFPVANMTRFMPVKIYDYYAPERFNETMLNAYNLFALSICHVCGSYQCPYCPFFSHATTLAPPHTGFMVLLAFLASAYIIMMFLGKPVPLANKNR